MEKPSLRVSGHVSSMNRTFIVEDHAEDEFGQRAQNEVTGEQGSLTMRDHVSGPGTTLSVPGSPDQSRPPGEKKKKEREKEKARDDPKGPEEHSLVMNKHKILNGGKKGTQFWRSQRKTRRAQKAMMVFRRVVFATSRTKAEERIKKEKAKKRTYPQSDSQPQKHPRRRIRPGLGIRRLVCSHWTGDSWTQDAGWFCTKS